MKFSVTKEKLLEALQQVQNVVSTRTHAADSFQRFATG